MAVKRFSRKRSYNRKIKRSKRITKGSRKKLNRRIKRTIKRKRRFSRKHRQEGGGLDSKIKKILAFLLRCEDPRYNLKKFIDKDGVEQPITQSVGGKRMFPKTKNPLTVFENGWKWNRDMLNDCKSDSKCNDWTKIKQKIESWKSIDKKHYIRTFMNRLTESPFLQTSKAGQRNFASKHDGWIRCLLKITEYLLTPSNANNKNFPFYVNNYLSLWYRD